MDKDLFKDVDELQQKVFNSWEFYHNLLYGLSYDDCGRPAYKLAEKEIKEILEELNTIIDKYK